MSLKNARNATYKAAQDILDGAKADGRELTPDEVSTVEGLIEEVRTLDAQIAAGHQKLADIFGAGSSDESLAKHGMGAGTKSLGRLDHLDGGFVPTGQAKGRGVLDLSAKGLRTIAHNASGNAVFGTSALGKKALVTAGQSIAAIPMLADVVNTGRPPASLLDVLRSRTTTTPTWQYLRQIGRDSNAAFVAAGGVKPTSDFSTETVDNQLRVLAHISGPVDKYVLGDAPALERFLVDEMNYGIRQALEAQVVGGNGTAPNLRGLLNTSGIQTQAFETDVLTTTRAAITAVETLGLSPDLFVIHPEDWEKLELLRQSNGDLDLGHLPIDRAARRLWGVQVVVSTAPSAGTALLLDSTSVELVTDGSLSVEWSDAVSDDFERNQKRVRVEGRFALDVFRPLGVVKISTAAA
ncbi:phage major capsid protein [Rhodococcus gordoniae]|uniref:phage major capsid protein n=1 Tax=Rhodococcus gordoniae TaxID=223392 RepID=UPI0020CD427F|nr:phage major capsid protein [Rhodococcus gordoniae]UTT48852.1 phage major capsid protein [Rhodococcus gordoniae]